MLQTQEQLRQQYGGKAAVLYALQEAGFLVPEFCVSPSDLAAAVDRLGLPLAVRSSATLEDGRVTSFAGQFESYLNLQSYDEVEAAVQRVRESAHSPQVRQYCRHNGISSESLRVEVVVQRMVQPDLAGVAFTVNPTTGNAEVVIEAVEGTGELLLAGSRPPLDNDHALLKCYREKIAEQALAIQRMFGCPQDIEFAIGDDQVYILQARPITRIQFSAAIGEWTNADFRDGGVSSTVCTPLMWSLYEFIWEHTLKSSLREVRLWREDFESSRMFFGRPYWNLGAVKQCVAQIPGFVEREFDLDLSVEPTYSGDGRRTPFSLRGIFKGLRSLSGISTYLRQQQQTAEQTLQAGFGDIAARYDPNTADLELQLQQLIEVDFFRLESTYFRTIFALSLSKLDFKFTFPHTDYKELVAFLPDMQHMAPLRRIRQMADEGTVDVDALIREFPHHSRRGLDICHPRWDEDREFVARLVEDTQQAQLVRRGARERNEATVAAAHVAKWRRRAFQRKLDRLRHFVWLREELRDLSSRMYHLIRQHVLELARRRGLEEDVFFMTFRELYSDDRRHIAERRATYDSYRNFQAPNEIGASFQHDTEIHQGSLHGIGASSGRVQAEVHVAANIEEALAAPPGCVLVCPFTEPSWTTVLDRTAAVVTETGGLLSHAAVICREYGIPAVLGVRDATRRIPHGATVAVDGSSGEVAVLE